MEPIWYQAYPAEVAHTITVDPMRTLLDVWDESCQKYGDRVAFTQFNRGMTYRELDKLSRTFAGYLQAKTDLKPGDRFAIMLPNLLQYGVALLGVLRAGLIVVNVNPQYTAREFADQILDSGARGVIVMANFADTVTQGLPEIKKAGLLSTVIVTEVGDLLGLKGLFMNLWVKYVAPRIKPWHIENHIKFKSCITDNFLDDFAEVVVRAQDTAFLQYTGGTTGKSKGAVLTHANLVANVQQCTAWMEHSLHPGKEIAIAALPLYHIFALTVNFWLLTAFGATNVLVLNPRDMNGFIKILSKYKFSIMTGVNTLFRELLFNKNFAKLDFKNLKICVAGGMQVQPTVAYDWLEVTGCVLAEGYGLTEASPVVSFNRLDESQYNHSIGLPLPSTEISIRGIDDDQELSIGQIGELWVRGPQVMREYWQQPDETKNVLTKDGWLRTGDIARVDDQGYIFIVDRKKEMIIISGFNVYPNEVEEVLVKIPGVREAGVVGERDSHGDEHVAAHIVRSDPNLTKEQIIQACHENLVRYKVPKKIYFRDQLPKSAVGKILRRKLAGYVPNGNQSSL